MEWFIGFLGAVIGTAAGGLSVFLTTRAQMRRELEHTYDQDLRARRVDAYKGLYKLTGKMPRYWPHNPVRSEMHEWPDAFDDLYFAEALRPVPLRRRPEGLQRRARDDGGRIERRARR